MTSDYIPISCAFYDELEACAVKKALCTIVYKEDEEIKTVEALIVDFKTLKKEEFMILDDCTQIRLDKIISFNNIKPKDRMYC